MSWLNLVLKVVNRPYPYVCAYVWGVRPNISVSITQHSPAEHFPERHADIHSTHTRTSHFSVTSITPISVLHLLSRFFDPVSSHTVLQPLCDSLCCVISKNDSRENCCFQTSWGWSALPISCVSKTFLSDPKVKMKQMFFVRVSLYTFNQCMQF